MIRISYLLVLALAGATLSSGESSDVNADQNNTKKVFIKDGSSLINTNINLFGAKLDDTLLRSPSNVVIDPAGLVDEEALARQANDIEEDENDRFITSRTGKLRPKYQQGAGSEDWSEEAGVHNSSTKVLSRVKRCGGGGGGDDDGGDANRSRRSRRARKARRARRRRNQQKQAQQNQTTTTVTRKVIQNGQVVSETVQPQTLPQVQSCAQQPAPQPIIIQQPAQTQPQVVQVQQPAVQQVQPAVQHVQPAVQHVQPAVQHVQPAVQNVQTQQPAPAQQPSSAVGASASGSLKLSI